MSLFVVRVHFTADKNCFISLSGSCLAGLSWNVCLLSLLIFPYLLAIKSFSMNIRFDEMEVTKQKSSHTMRWRQNHNSNFGILLEYLTGTWFFFPFKFLPHLLIPEFPVRVFIFLVDSFSLTFIICTQVT